MIGLLDYSSCTRLLLSTSVTCVGFFLHCLGVEKAVIKRRQIAGGNVTTRRQCLIDMCCALEIGVYFLTICLLA